MQKRQEEQLYSGTEEAFDANLAGSPTEGAHLQDCQLLQVLQETKVVERAGSQLGGASSMPCDKEASDDIVIGPMPNAHTPPTGDKQTRAAQVQAAFLCGVINGIITIPVMTSFAAIIFQASPSYYQQQLYVYHTSASSWSPLPLE